MTVVLDTNALMMPVECDVRVFEELERLLDGVDYLVPAAVRAELDALASGTGGEAAAASVGLDLADERCETRETNAEYADDAVLELAVQAGASHVVTNDGPLQERVLAEGISVISLRAKNKLAITQP
ncbi:MAG: twitching motility protein PilT [Halovenus sp.]